MILLSEQSEIDADSRVDWLEKVLIVLFRVVNVATDGVACHLGGWKWHEKLFQVRRSRFLVQPQIVCFGWHYHRHAVMNCR